MKAFFSKAVKTLPHPFKSFQRYYQIEEEVLQLKTYFKPYKFSLFIFFGLLSYPFFKEIARKYYETTEKRVLSLFSALNQSKIEASSKEIMNSILNDPSIRKEGALYIERLTKETLVKDSVLKLLENTVKDPQFIKSSKELAKDLGQDLIKDPEIESKIINLTLKTLKSGEIKEEIGNLVKWVFLQERTKERLVDLLKSGFEDEKLRNALTNAFSHSFYEVLNQKETIEKLKMFSYFLMENDPEESENVRNMIDTIIEKIVNKKREDTTKSELDKILNVVNEDLEKEKAKEKTEKKEKVL